MKIFLLGYALYLAVFLAVLNGSQRIPHTGEPPNCLALAHADGVKPKDAPRRIEPAQGAELLEGWYACTGEAGDATYHGAATVRKVGEQYLVRWVMDGGAAAGTVLGTGIRTGDLLSIGWGRGEIVGVSVFRIEDKGVLRGSYVQWPTPTGKKQKETLTWEKPFATPTPKADTEEQ